MANVPMLLIRYASKSKRLNKKKKKKEQQMMVFNQMEYLRSKLSWTKED